VSRCGGAIAVGARPDDRATPRIFLRVVVVVKRERRFRGGCNPMRRHAWSKTSRADAS
jgi:hypothetical protein